jgi:hypothetical protein
VGINLDATGAPVKAAGLFDLGIGAANTAEGLAPVQALVSRILASFQEEVRGIEWACAKVRPVV